MKSRIWTISVAIFLVLRAFTSLYSQDFVSGVLSTETIVTMIDLPFVPPLHKGEESIQNPKDLPDNLQEAYNLVREALVPSENASQGERDLFGRDFGELVRIDFESFAPITRKLQEIRVLQVYESEAKDYSWFKIVLFSEPETLNLVVYLEKEENQWKITGVESTIPN